MWGATGVFVEPIRADQIAKDTDSLEGVDTSSEGAGVVKTKRVPCEDGVVVSNQDEAAGKKISE